MKKLIKRLLIFSIGLPALLSLVIFFPQHNHLLLNVGSIIFSVLGAVEFRNILIQKNMVISVAEAIVLGAISPAAWTVVVSFGVMGQIVPGAFILGASWLLVSGIFSRQKFDSYLGRVVAGFAVMIYPGLFIAWIIQMAILPEASMVILVYFLVVFLNDSAAWAAGMLFGNGNRGYVAASPNKSIAGFIGGLGASLITGIAAAIFFPGAFTSTSMASIAAGALLGLGAGIAATLGDLGESALKRSAGVKDSGTLIMGRGGALDSIDSLALAAPVYYILYQILF
ncbi:MAG: phosphatidate cytidylyltransferase [Treponema sp.]|jgi:phosphatidate cytidylyltransferase|nr:phosphatidate cytidylyltransferase [Treponema sp.]